MLSRAQRLRDRRSALQFDAMALAVIDRERVDVEAATPRDREGGGAVETAAQEDNRFRLHASGTDVERVIALHLSTYREIHRETDDMEPTETPSADQLETFPNPRPGRDFTIEIVCPEFTSVCPKTGQPDFGTITFTYTPGESCVELKSLKLYLQRFRNQGIFYEQVTNQMLDDFVAACKPVRCKVVSAWTPRGGITTNVTCEYEAKEK